MRTGYSQKPGASSMNSPEAHFLSLVGKRWLRLTEWAEVKLQKSLSDGLRSVHVSTDVFFGQESDVTRLIGDGG